MTLRHSIRRALLTSALALVPAASWAEQVVISEVMYHPATAKPEYIEILNISSKRYDIAKWQLTGGIDFTFPDFNPAAPSVHFLKEYERIVVSSADPAATRAAWPSISPGLRVYGPWSGRLDNAGDRITLEDAAGVKVCELDYGDNGKWPVAADGAGHSLIVIDPDRAIDDWRNWRSSRLSGGSPGNAEIEFAEEAIVNPEPDIRTTLTVTEFNSTPGTGVPAVPFPANPGDTKWKYYNGVAAPLAEWKDHGFDDSGWEPSDPSLGYAPLGTDPQTSATFPGIRTPVALTSELATYYYRTTFNWIGALAGNTFVVQGFCDDGAVFHLNGQEIGRVRLAAAPAVISHTTTANNSSPETLEASLVSGNNTSLDGRIVSGMNTLAIEVHNVLLTNNDQFIAPRLKITGAPPGVIINEVKPSTVAGGGFVEFYNPTAATINLNGYYLTDDPANLTKFQITQSIPLLPGQLATVGFAESNLTIGESVVVYLTQPNGQVKQSAISVRMPTDGRSVGRKPTGSGVWYIFQQATPGAPNQSSSAAAFAGRLSEAHFGATGHVDWVEFANPSAVAAAGGGFFVASTLDFSDKMALPASIPAGGYASVATDLIPDGGGDVVLYLIDAENNIIEAAELTHRPGLDSVQRWPVGSREWYNSATSTMNAANAPARHEEIVINEIMAAPPSSHTAGEFVELYNRSGSAVSLSGWAFVDGISFDFPAGAVLGAGEYLVVAKDPDYMAANYPGILYVYGPFSGTLRNRGELIRLEDERHNLSDWVDYHAGGQWPESGGSSLELIHPDMDNSLPSSWRSSDESTKSSFQTYTYTDTYRELRGAVGTTAERRELLVNLVADGHIVMRNISLTRAGSGNLIPTGDATSHTGSGAAGFLCTGTHHMSDTLADGFHLISTGTGDTKNNKAEVDCIDILPGNVLTLSFDARWISGVPVLSAQTWDRSFGKIFRLPIPNHLGTPSSANSAAIPVPAPTVDDMLHSPAVPTSAQSVVVTAKVSSAVGLTGVEFVWRVDNINANGAWASNPMNDSGTAGDAVAGDGTWSGTLAPQSNDTLIQFYIRATAPNGRTQECPRNGAVYPGMWIVDNTPPSAQPGTLTERYVISRYHRDALGTAGFTSKFDWNFPRMSNFEFNATVITREKDIRYNAGFRKGGSPWTRDSGNGMARLRWKPPGDNPFRNRTKTWLDNDSAGPSRFHNHITRYQLYLFGYPVPDNEFVQNIVNESNPLLNDDIEPSDSDFFDRAYEDGSSGELFEIDDAWYMFDTFTNGNENRISADSVTGRWSLNDWSGQPAYPSQESPIFFHGNWPVRFPEDRYDYAALGSLIKYAWNNNSSANTNTAAWIGQMDRMLDMDRTAIYAAVRGYCADWDNFTRDRGKNGYFYRRSTDGIFEFHHWDTDLGWRGSDYGAAVTGSAAGIGWTNYANNPIFRRRLVYYLDEMVKKYTKNSPRMNAWLDANNYQAANSHALAPYKIATVPNPTYPTFFTNREATIISQINAGDGVTPTYTRPFAITTANGQTVATPLFSISGFAPSAVWIVDVLDHPEALAAWTSKAGWTVSNIALASGANSLTVRALAQDGSVISTLPFTVTYTGNGAPIAVLTTDPPSLNVSSNEFIVLDGTRSMDPEGGALTFAWTVTPLNGATVTHSVPGKTEASFTVPGVYTVSMMVTDPSNLSTSISREVTVFATSDFRPFGNATPLDASLTVENAESRDNYSPSAWYSIEDDSGRLLLQVLDDSAKPLGNPNFTHPLVTRDLPDTADFTLQTDVLLDTRQFGNFLTGLWVEFTDGGQAVRYAFGIDGGLNINLHSATGAGAWVLVGGIPHTTGTGAILRVRRTGTQLSFDRRANGVWAQVRPATLGPGAVALRGGVFLSTSAPTTARSSFDYLLVADPANTNSVVANLRITEVMYNPATGGVEYIELQNTGTQSINLLGVTFADGSPFGVFTFGSEILAPGEFIVITENAAAFQAKYGAGIRLGGAWLSGNLSNGGEEVVLLDPFGNEIHRFTFRDNSDPAWPAAADGTGPSLEVINVHGDYNDGSNWRASAEAAGNPGSAGGAPDSDGDGIPDHVEIAFGTDPGDPGSLPAATSSTAANGRITIAWPSVAGRSYRVEKSLDLVTWQIVTTVTGGSWEDPSTPSNSRSYYRISAVP
ncbi:MAG: lamin tail domain-containing protein [Verrucomicrobiales bacterium]